MRMNTSVVKDAYRSQNGGKKKKNGRVSICGSKLGMKLFKSRSRAVARIQRLVKNGNIVPDSAYKAAGFPLNDRPKVQTPKRKKFLGLI